MHVNYLQCSVCMSRASSWSATCFSMCKWGCSLRQWSINDRQVCFLVSFSGLHLISSPSSPCLSRANETLVLAGCLQTIAHRDEQWQRRSKNNRNRRPIDDSNPLEIKAQSQLDNTSCSSSALFALEYKERWVMNAWVGEGSERLQLLSSFPPRTLSQDEHRHHSWRKQQKCHGIQCHPHLSCAALRAQKLWIRKQKAK